MSDGDGAAEYGLTDWLPQLPQEVHPMIGLFCKGPDVQIPLEVLGDDGAQETERLCADLGSHRVMEAWVSAHSALSLKSRTIPTILRALSSNSFRLNYLKRVEMVTIKTSTTLNKVLDMTAD